MNHPPANCPVPVMRMLEVPAFIVPVVSPFHAVQFITLAQRVRTFDVFVPNVNAAHVIV